jgi:hypothetical protein
MRIHILTLCVIFAHAISSGATNPTTEAAQRIMTRHQDSVLWITGTCKVTVSTEGGSSSTSVPDREQRVAALATVVDADGLLVTSLSRFEPQRNFGGPAGRQGRNPNGGRGRGASTRGDRPRFERTISYKDVQIIKPNGKEIPAEVVMKDSDLDLVFIRAKPDRKAHHVETFKAVDLKDNAKASIAEVLITVGRADETLNGVPTVDRGQVTCVMAKPRELLTVSSMGLGIPTFNLEGKLVGIGVMRRMNGQGAIPVVIAAEDILDLVQQAKNARPAQPEQADPPSENRATADQG